MHTDADEHRDKARAHINEAISHINKIVVEQCLGWDMYTTAYSATLRRVHGLLLRLRDML